MRRVASVLSTILLSGAVLLTSLPSAHAQADYKIEKVFYGFGWRTDSETGLDRNIALLNLTEGFEETYPGDGLYSTFKQLFVEFSTPTNESGPEAGPGLGLRFSYHLNALCHNLSGETCPLGDLQSASSQDTFHLEVRRILEFVDGDGNGTYDPGETVVQQVHLAQAIRPFVEFEAYGPDWLPIDVPFNWNQSWEAGNLTQGALSAEDPLLEEVWGFRVTVGAEAPINFTMESFLFLQPSVYRGIPLTPSELKLDISMRDISYAQEGTVLALELGLSSSQYRFQANSTGTAGSLLTPSTAAEAYFRWNATATVDGETGTVGSTVVPSNESAVVLYLAYPRGESIVHDPVLGVVGKGEVIPMPPNGEGPPSLALWQIGLISTVAVAMVVATFALLRRRLRGG